MTVYDYLTLPERERDSALRSMSRDDLESLARVALGFVERLSAPQPRDEIATRTNALPRCCDE